MELLETGYFGYTLRTHLSALSVFLGFLLGFRLARGLVLERLRALAAKTTTKIDDLIVELLDMVRTPEQYLVAFWLATRPYAFPDWLEKGFRAVVVIAVTFRAVTMLQRALAFGLTAATDDTAPGGAQTRRTVTLLANATVWIVAVLFVLSNLGFDITSMIAGLGIGGIAVALAAQAVLGDLFSAVAIWLDRPFELGDAISFDGFSGSVEDIGIKTTRVRAASGELLVVPNASLTSTKIQNFKRMAERRVVLPLQVSYKTPLETLARLPGLVEAIVKKDDRLRFDRAHVDKLSESSIDLEVVYWVRTDDYGVHMAAKERLLLAVLKALEQERVEIPYPHRAVIMTGPTAS
ncbi:MAG: mechanosensitive ion channel family protein [Elusimicrobia bacterium]|nr:mechanosensitive ion channel family protein [Elusimicrobiota bacterium]